MKPCLKSRDRRGQSLILIIFILIALIGVMALTLDFGFVLLARRQMQTGVNAAALEGLRGQGISQYDVNGEQLRRENARHIQQLTYDDDFDLSVNETTVGAGIDSSLIQGNGYRQTTIGSPDSTLKEVLDRRHEYIYRPDPQLNTENFVHGDMVAGQYVDPSALDVEQRPIAGRVHEEFSTYERTDFRTPEDDDYNSDIGSRAFLVRIRRSHNPDGLDEEPTVSSRGGGLPLMLARAGWMSAEEESADYSIRRDGVTVRATAIAQGSPALAVGKANAAHDLRGLANFVLSTDFWVSNDWEESAIEGEESIEVTVSGTQVEYSGQNVGHLIDHTRSNVSVGERVSELGTSSGMESGFAPLYGRVRCLGNGTTDEERVVAFGDIVSVKPEPDDTDTYRITRRRTSVGTQNVSAIFLRTDHLADPSCPVDMNHLMEQRRAVPVTGPAGEKREVLLRPFVVLAPTLVRTIR